MARSSLNLKILLFYLFNIFVSTLSPRISFICFYIMVGFLIFRLSVSFSLYFFLLSQRRLITFINRFIPKRLQLVSFATFKSLIERKPLKKKKKKKRKKKKFTETLNLLGIQITAKLTII